MKTSDAIKYMLQYTRLTNDSLTPSIKLHLITEACPLWMSTPEECVFPNPFWAFYWPGGQALTRYILDNPCLFKDSSVLDWGCGCGASSIASNMVGAHRIIANDIDKYALIASQLNYEVNKVPLSRTKFIERDLCNDDGIHELSSYFTGSNGYILLGDMFYDCDFASTAFTWLKRVQAKTGARILAGDPDRHPLADKKYLEKYETKFEKKILHEYPLPGYVTREHYGFSSAKVLEIVFG